MPETLLSIDALLERMVARSASDLHVTVGTPPAMRVNGALERYQDVPDLSPEDTHQMLYRILSTEQQKVLEINRQIDFAHSIPGLERFRVNQREIGPDASSFAEALRAALREDPDVILLGEMRDLETISTAITAAETGHLVFATLHTQSAPSTVDRIIDAFPAAQQEQVRVQLAVTLQGICTQALLPTQGGTGRVPALEILFPDDAVRNLIRQGKVEQVYSVMQTGTSKGMQTMEQALADLVLRKVITLDDALSRSSRAEQLFGLLERAGMDVAPHEDSSKTPPLAAGLRVAGT